MKKARAARDAKSAPMLVAKDALTTRFLQSLPFGLTGAQQRAWAEIAKDLAGEHPMQRLLQGDVGSGKTIVALLSMLISADNRNPETGEPFQSLLMAPTEILAQQHYAGICDLVKQLPVTVMLLTGSTKTKERKEILRSCADGSLTILIGTHAVIEDHVQFRNLGFAVVDEQHKFGVHQRLQLGEGDDRTGEGDGADGDAQAHLDQAAGMDGADFADKIGRAHV